MNKQNRKKRWVAIAGLLVVIIALGALYLGFVQKPAAGEKNITVEVVISETEKKAYEYNTELEFLGEVLVEEKLVEGDKGEYGLFITVVDGVRADDAKQQWWCITKEGGQVNTSADTTPIFDGDKYEITLTEGY